MPNTTTHTYTIDQFVDLVIQNARAKPARWLNCTVQIEGFPAGVGVKAHGRWVQRVECSGIADGLPEARTLAQLRTDLTDLLGRIQRAFGV